MDTTSRLRDRLQREHSSAKAKIQADLIFLRQGIERALQALERGDAVDEHLITNVNGTTHTIVHYNMQRDLIPYLEKT